MIQNAGDIFIDATKYPSTTRTDAALGRPEPTRPRPSGNTRVLPDPLKNHLAMDLTTALQTRRSLRMFTGSAITEEQLSYLLWATQGITGQSEMFRSSPSAGAIHPIDIYVAIQNVTGLPIGIWRYYANGHMLELIEEGPNAISALGKACMMQPAVMRAPVLFCFVATPYRTVWKYGVRGYRDIFLDAGHLCENLYLAGTQEELGICGIGAFYDDEAHKALNLSKDQIFLYAAACGHPKK
ncbi:SagB/ThcOx family dehydrogenase [uncultured Methanocorpusculum sp.]|nr:SagB/ThcOx family dehydrogenase [uncultured Methanocorpusculum sp.]